MTDVRIVGVVGVEKDRVRTVRQQYVDAPAPRSTLVHKMLLSKVVKGEQDRIGKTRRVSRG